MERSLECSDVELVAQGGGGDASAWDEFVARFNRRIVAYVVRERRARGVAASSAEGEVVRDFVQDVYVRLLAKDRRESGR